MRAGRLATWATWVLVFASIAFVPWGLGRWVFPKEIAVGVACLLASFAAARGKLPRWLWIAAAAAGALFVIGALTGAAPLAQLMGRWPRFEGIVTLPVYLAAGWAGARLLGPGADGLRRASFTRAVAIASVLLGAVSLIEAAGLRPISSNLERPGALLGNATDQGIIGVMFLAVLWLPTLAALREPADRAWRWVFLAGTTFAAITAVASASRAAILALVGVVLIAGVVMVVRARGKARAAATAAGALAAVMGAIALVPLARDRVLGLSELSGDTVSDRFAGWSETFNLVVAHPFGVGSSGYVDRIPLFHSDTWFAQVGATTVVDSPHNWMLQSLAAGGWPLLLVALALLGAVVYAAVRGIRSADRGRSDLLTGSLLALVAWAAILLTHFTGPGNTILAATLVGVVVAVPAASAVRVAWSRVRTAAFAVWVALLGVTGAAEIPLQAGLDASSGGDTESATESFEVAHALRPWDADLLSIAAQSFAASAEVGVVPAAPLAVEWADRSLALAPDSVATLAARATGEQYSGEFTAGISTLQRGLELSPNDPSLLHRLGGLYALGGDFTSARSALERAVDLDPNLVNAWLTLQYVYEQQGDTAAAQRAAERVSELGR